MESYLAPKGTTHGMCVGGHVWKGGGPFKDYRYQRCCCGRMAFGKTPPPAVAGVLFTSLPPDEQQKILEYERVTPVVPR